MYELISQSESKRTYRSSQTGTEVNTVLLHTTPDGRAWWAFEDLLSIPFIRKKAAEKLTNLYGAGVTKDDLDKTIARFKAILKGTEDDKYERIYSEVLQLESAVNSTADPIRQSLSLCAVYILSESEKIDTFSWDEVKAKMECWALQPEAQAFFLSWLTDGMNAYTSIYNTLTQTVLTPTQK